MLIWPLSDLHLEARPWQPAERPDFDVLVVAGDVRQSDVVAAVRWTAAVADGKPALFVPGNHEIWGFSIGETDRMGRLEADRLGVVYLQNSVAVVAGLVFAGATLWDVGELAGAERPDLRKILAGTQPEPMPHGALPYGEPVHIQGPDVMDRRAKNYDIRRIHGQSSEMLASSGADVVVSHHAPSDALVARTKEGSLWIHGHRHGFGLRDHPDGRRVLRNAAGYPAEIGNGFDPMFTIEAVPVPSPKP